MPRPETLSPTICGARLSVPSGQVSSPSAAKMPSIRATRVSRIWLPKSLTRLATVTGRTVNFASIPPGVVIAATSACTGPTRSLPSRCRPWARQLASMSRSISGARAIQSTAIRQRRQCKRNQVAPGLRSISRLSLPQGVGTSGRRRLGAYCRWPSTASSRRCGMACGRVNSDGPAWSTPLPVCAITIVAFTDTSAS